MAEFRDCNAEFEAAGARILALSVDDPSRSAPLRAQLDLPFSILCDPSRETVQAWGLFNAKEKGGIAIPATFLIDRDRKVRFASAEAVARRVSAAEMLAFVRATVGRGPSPQMPVRVKVRPRLAHFGRALLNSIRRGFVTPRV